MKIEWLVVSPNPRTHNPLNPNGTVIHAVDVETRGTRGFVKTPPSVCGIYPRYGWSVDMFMEEECRRCERIMAKRAELRNIANGA